MKHLNSKMSVKEKCSELASIVLDMNTPRVNVGSFSTTQSLLIELVDGLPIDTLRMFAFKWRRMLTPTKNYNLVGGNNTDALRAILKRTLDTMFEARERDRLVDMTIGEKSAVLRDAIKRLIAKHNRAIGLARRREAPDWYFEQLSMYFAGHAFATFVNLDLDIRRFAAYMMQAVVYETTGFDIKPDKTDAYVEYDYMLAAERQYANDYRDECDKTTAHWLRIASTMRIVDGAINIRASALNPMYLGAELSDL